MKIEYYKKYIKSYAKLAKEKQKKVDEAISEFIENPFNPKLKNHLLHGKMKAKRAISAGYDLRIIFEEKDGYMLVIFLDLGNHIRVY